MQQPGRTDQQKLQVFEEGWLFAVAWVGQFVGHQIEGKKPSFLKDLQFLLVGPAWLLHFVYRKVGLPI